jgi:hypothetical protein
VDFIVEGQRHRRRRFATQEDAEAWRDRMRAMHRNEHGEWLPMETP